MRARARASSSDANARNGDPVAKREERFKCKRNESRAITEQKSTIQPRGVELSALRRMHAISNAYEEKISDMKSPQLEHERHRRARECLVRPALARRFQTRESRKSRYDKLVRIPNYILHLIYQNGAHFGRFHRTRGGILSVRKRHSTTYDVENKSTYAEFHPEL